MVTDGTFVRQFFVGEGLIPSRAWESRIQRLCCRSFRVREGINPSPTLGLRFLFNNRTHNQQRPHFRINLHSWGGHPEA